MFIFLKKKTSPPDDPPGVRRKLCGFNVSPVTKLSVSQLVQYSGVFETSNGMAPEAIKLVTTAPSSVALIPFLGNEPTLSDMPTRTMIYNF